jgi:NitT/TauT family transport system substrate-binding protein
VLLLCVVLVAAGCGGKGAASESGQAGATTLRLGYFPNITHATAIIGVQSGIFARNLGGNVKLQTLTFNAGPAAVEALFSGALDASYMGPNPAVNAYVRSKGEAVRIIAGATSGGTFLVVRPEIGKAADLKGKRVASPELGNTQDVALRGWLQAQGLKTDTAGGGDVSVTPQENSQTLQAFKSGQIAGAWVPEPWATRLVQEGGGKILVDERTLWPNGQFPTTELVVRTAYLQQHPDAVAGLLRGQVEATSYVNAHPAEAQQAVNAAIQQLTGQRLTDATLAAAWQQLSFTNDPNAGALRTVAGAAAGLGFLKLDGVDLARLFNLAPLNTALKAAGGAEVPSS